MKYRYLTDEELSYFAEELKQFLIINGIYNEEWIEMNSQEPEKAKALVGIFSDQVLTKIYHNISYLELRSDERCTVMHLTDSISEILIMERKPENLFPVFNSPEEIHVALTKNLPDIQFFKAQKSNSQPKEELIHHYLQQGFVPSSKEFWDSLVILTQ
jgi:hypothetical protein